MDDDDRRIEQYHQNYQQQHEINNYNSVCGKKSWRKKQYVYKHRLQQKPNSYGSVKGLSSIALTPGRSGRMQHPHRAWSESDGLDQCGGSLAQQYRNLQKPQLLPPPPIPYYCAAEAAASGFVQYVHKNPGGWWTRTKNKRRRRRYRNIKRKPSEKTTSIVDRHRSSSAGGNGCTITDDENSDGSGSGSNSDHGEYNSDEQDSDGEFIGMLAAAAAFGQDPDREWSQFGNAGDPVADWDKYDFESDSSLEQEDDDMVEWTTEIMATDMRRKQSHQNLAIPSRIVHDNYLHFCDAQSLTPVFTNRQLHHQSRQELIGHQQQFNRPLPLPQFRPQPLEPPPPPPALSVAFTAVACPWWTVLEDVLHVNAKTSGDPSSSNKTGMWLPLLTFD
ncbi:PREDICTED: uncharacterized protein LOC107164002 [Diuraphis noxia]|nr:PREDICTED: uncharacterized protein LOC107164002 [Diuraphis noxia]